MDTFDVRVIAHAADYAEGVIPPSLAPYCRQLGLKGLINPRRWLQINRAVADSKPDILVTVNQIATILATIGKFLGLIRCPIVVIFHSTNVPNFSGWIRTIPFFPAVWLSNAIVYVSENQRKFWTRRGLIARQVKAIVNGIDFSPFSVPDAASRVKAKERLGFKPDDYVIGQIAVFRREKNHQELIHALVKLKTEHTITAKALFVGDGPTRPMIEALALQYGISDQLYFAGMQKDVIPYIRAMDVGVITSITETLSLAALETMAMGVPMVMSDIGGASEIIEHGINGMLYKAQNTQGLVNNLADIYENKMRWSLGSKARQTIETKFTFAKMIAAYTHFFHALLSTARGNHAG